MRREVERDRWATFLEEFTRRNQHCAAQVQISGQVDAPLVEGGIPLTGITVEMEGSGAPLVEISLGGVSPDARRVLRRLPLVCGIALRADARDDALEVKSEGGVRALVYFEPPTDTPTA